MNKIKIGMVGVGAISGIYLKNLTTLFKEIELVALCDLVKEKAIKVAEEYKIPKIYDTMEELFVDEEIDIVLNLTRPYEGKQEIPLLFDYKQNSRGLGLADMAKSLQTGREFRADYHQTLHVLEVITSFERSSAKGEVEEIAHKYTKPFMAMKNNPMIGVLD